MKPVTAASVTMGPEGELVIQGLLNYETVPGIQSNAQSLLPSLSQITVNLQDVEYSDSAGLALLAEWYRYAKSQQRPFLVKHIPSQLLAIAKVTGMDEILGFGH